MVSAFWNLFLGIVPVALGLWFARGLADRRRGSGPNRAVVLVVGLGWLAFLPNAAYMLTDFRHYLFDDPWRALHGLGEWNRDAMLASAAWGGLFLGYGVTGLVLLTLAVRPVHREVVARGHGPWRWGTALFVLASFGVYLGLIYRLNSWDVVNRPHRVVWAAADVCSRWRSVAAVLGFAAFLGGAYLGIDAAIDGLLLRVRRFQRARSEASSPSRTERA